MTLTNRQALELDSAKRHLMKAERASSRAGLAPAHDEAPAL